MTRERVSFPYSSDAAEAFEEIETALKHGNREERHASLETLAALQSAYQNAICASFITRDEVIEGLAEKLEREADQAVPTDPEKIDLRASIRSKRKRELAALLRSHKGSAS
jgi:hypothetical protein